MTTAAGPWQTHSTLAAELAPHVSKHLGYLAPTEHPYDETTGQAIAHLPAVIEYVRGYTRGRGFVGDRPADPLLVVIVAAAARLVANPTQLNFYQTGDYSERPAILNGWTLPELAVLNRYRRIRA
jgi:hypothetical protein